MVGLVLHARLAVMLVQLDPLIAHLVMFSF